MGLLIGRRAGSISAKTGPCAPNIPPKLTGGGGDGLQLRNDEIQRDFVVSALGDQDVRPSFARLDELEVHGPHGPVVLLVDLFERSTARFHVAADATKDADVGVGVDEDLQVESGSSGSTKMRIPSTMTMGTGWTDRVSFLRECVTKS